MNIIKERTRTNQICFLNSKKTIYSCDFRATGESFSYQIPEMWKYENLTPWLLNKGYALINNDNKIEYQNTYKPIVVPKSKHANESIYSRALNIKMPATVSKLWVAVPHPDADKLAQQLNLKLNYNYNDFLQKNDKLTQKELLGDISPKWLRVKTLDDARDFETKYPNCYIKRRVGSGGFTVFTSENKFNEPKLTELFRQSPTDWYVEKRIVGNSYSIQCLIKEKGDDVSVFGYAKQEITDDKYFTGAHILPLVDLSQHTLQQLTTAISRLKPLLNNYQGFFGIDFIQTRSGKIYILEANIRMTALTIPTLIINELGGPEGYFKEDNNVPSATIVLSWNNDKLTGDTLSIPPLQNDLLGKSIHFTLKDVSQLKAKIHLRDIIQLKQLITDNVCEVKKYTYYNFWPYGWTACYILAESHCVISSWFQEKKVTVDIFSCNQDLEFDSVISALIHYYEKSVLDNLYENKR